jgi:hypothetical protein
MALVKFKSPLASFRGRSGTDADGQVYYDLDGRGIGRDLVIPKNPNTTEQQQVRSINMSIATMYKGLSRPQAEAWNAFGRNFVSTDSFGRKYKYGGMQAFQAVNAHRALANQTLLTEPPAFARVPAPMAVESVTVSAPNIVSLAVRHLQAASSGYWRVRLSPPLPSPVRLAAAGDLRMATSTFRLCYVAIAASVQTIVLTTRYAYYAPETLGVEILGLSNDFVPGQAIFVRHIVVAE